MVVASDRISAFDRILPTEIPDKGKILTQMSLWWFEQLKQVPNHVLSTDVPDVVAGRAMICRSLNMFPVECIVRGYLTGSGLAAYNETGEIAGVKLPAGLVDGSRLDTPIFTPTGKAEVGEHDELVTREELYAEVGQPVGERLEELSLSLYTTAGEDCPQQGIILADTKMEFGTDSYRGEITLGDEVLTPTLRVSGMRPSTSRVVHSRASISSMCVTGCVPRRRVGTVRITCRTCLRRLWRRLVPVTLRRMSV